MGRSAASWAALLAALLATLLGDPVPARWLCRLVPDHADGRTVFPAGEWLGGLGGSPGGPAAGSDRGSTLSAGWSVSVAWLRGRARFRSRSG